MRGPNASRALHGFAVLTAAATFLLLIAGALVVGNEAGLAVPDWPLSYGTWMPPMEGGIFYEHGHRMIAATVGLLTTVLAIWFWRREPRRWVIGLGLAAWLAVVVQAVLGGITVLYRLPIPVLVGHALLAQAFFCLMVSLALFTSPAWNRAPEPIQETRGPAFRHLCAAATAALFVQLVLGATLRHKALGLGPHLVWAGVASMLVGWVCFRAITELGEQAGLQKLARLVGAIWIVQLGLGGASYFLRAMTREAVQPQSSVVVITTAHLAVGALLLSGSLVLTLLAWRRQAVCKRVSALTGSPQRTLA